MKDHNLSHSRRNFIKGVALSTAAIAGPSTALAMSIKPPPTSQRSVKALVIGSGFGGAVCGLRLAEAGIKTLMLERGQWWEPEADKNIFSANLPADHRSSWFKKLASPPIKIETPILKYAGVLDYTDFGGLRTYQGAAVGGGSIIYGGVTVRSPGYILESIFAGEVNVTEFESVYYPKAEAMIGATEIPDEILSTPHYRYARLFNEHADAAGYVTKKASCAYDFDIIQQEIDGTIKESALKGETIYGNNNGCKKTLVQSYIQPALDTGNLAVAALTEVERIRENSEGQYEVYTRTINPWGIVLSYQVITCEHLFMGAGTVGTNKLLLKAKAMGDLPNLNEYVGTQVGNNGGVTWARTVQESTGSKQAAPLNTTLDDFNNPYGPLSIECAYFPTGIDTHSLVHLGVFFNQQRPGPGTFSYSNSFKGMQLDWPSDANDKSIQAHKHTVNRLNEVNGGFAGVPLLITEPSGNRTAHPLGGMPLGLATDAYGRVKGYSNLYVMDGTLIPGSCLANPSLTIAALAERNIEKILQDDIV